MELDIETVTYIKKALLRDKMKITFYTVCNILVHAEVIVSTQWLLGKGKVLGILNIPCVQLMIIA